MGNGRVGCRLPPVTKLTFAAVVELGLQDAASWPAVPDVGQLFVASAAAPLQGKHRIPCLELQRAGATAQSC